MRKLGLYFMAGSILLGLSCTKSQFDDYVTSSGTANFSNYIALGNSFTQGLQDGGLHNEYGQQDNSYPAIIAGQMSTPFVQPTVYGTGSGYFHLAYIDGEIEVIKAYDKDITNNHPLAIDYDPSFTNWADTTVKYNNLGVGGINLRNIYGNNSTEELTYHIYLGSTAPAPLAWNGVQGEPISPYGRFLNFGDINNRVQYIDHIKKCEATFFTNWLGINDIMSWAKEGGDDVSGSALITPLNEFETKYDFVLTVFQNMGADGVCATIHDLTLSPYFTTITLEVLEKDVWIKEGADTNIIRKAVEEDLILLTAKDFLGDGVGDTQANPLPHTVVLDRDEVVIVRNTINSYNSVIKNSAQSHGFYVVDMYAFMNGLSSGMTFDGIDFSTKYIEGGAYSLDGLHPNTRGYAMIANEFIRVINESYGSSLTPVSVGSYRGITFP
jgi:lysophospholipase L1-like esterase